MRTARKAKTIRSRFTSKSERGQALIEFAVSILFLMLLIFGMFELVLLVYSYNVLADSAKEGVRYAIVHGTKSGSPSGPSCPCPAIDGPVGTGVVKTFAQLSLHDTSTMTVNVDYNPGGHNGASACNGIPCLVRVTGSYPYQPFFALGWTALTVNTAAEGRIAY